MVQPKSLYETILPLIVANFVVGVGVWPGKTRWHRVVNILYPLLCLLCFAVFTKITSSYIIGRSHDFGTWMNHLSRIIFLALYYVNICLTLCVVITGWWRVKTMKIAFARITECEKTIRQMGIDVNYRSFYMYQIYSLGIVAVVLLVFVLIHNIALNKWYTPLHIQILFMIVMHYPVALLYVTDVTFMQWVRYSKIRFKQLNDLLRRMLTTTPDSPQHKRVLRMKDEWSKSTVVASATKQKDRRTDDNTDTMRAVKQIHLELIKCTRITNEAYGLQILLSMTVSFVFITSLLFNAYTIYWDGMPNEAKREMVPFVCWILFYASKVFIINHMCALTSIEAASTGDIICELYEPSTSKEFRAEIRDFTLQLIQNPLIFTACGFFNLDHTFIHGVIGSITTYLVILIQVGEIPRSLNATISYNETDFVTDIPL